MNKKVNGLGIASLVFGILGILLICACGLGVVFGLIGVILGILGLTVMKDRGKGIAVAGTIVSGVALTFGLVWVGMYIWGGKSQPTDYLSSETTVEELTDYEALSEEQMQEEMEKLNQQLEEMQTQLEEEKEKLTEKEEEIKEEEANSEDEASLEEGSEEESNEVNPDLIAFLDSYEAYAEQYLEFCKSYDASNYDMLIELSELMIKAAEFEEQAVKWEEMDDLSETDATYYATRMLKINAKLLEAAAEMTK